MHRTRTDWGHAGAGAGDARPAAAVRAHDSTADVVFEWNQILQDTVPAPQNPLTPRFFAMTHIAMFDAINTIEREFEPYRVRLRHWPADRRRPRPRRRPTTCSSPSTRPRRRPTTRRWRASSAPHPSGFVRRGAAVGARSPRRSWRGARTTAGSCRRSRPIPSRRCPGRWQPTPPTNADRRPSRTCRMPRRWRCSAPTQFLPPPPPSLHQRALRHRLERSQADRQVGQRDAHARADGDRPAVGRHRRHRRRHRHQLHVDLEHHRPRRGAGAPAVAGRNGAGVRARERLGARRRCRPRRRASSSTGCGVRSRRFGRPTPISMPRPIPDADLAAAAHHAAVSVVCRQHGDDRRERGPRAAARLRHQRHAGDGDVAAVGRAAGRLARSSPASGRSPRSRRTAASTAASTTGSTSSPASRSAGRPREFVFANFMTPRDRWDD